MLEYEAMLVFETREMESFAAEQQADVARESTLVHEARERADKEEEDEAAMQNRANLKGQEAMMALEEAYLNGQTYDAISWCAKPSPWELETPQ